MTTPLGQCAWPCLPLPSRPGGSAARCQAHTPPPARCRWILIAGPYSPSAQLSATGAGAAPCLGSDCPPLPALRRLRQQEQTVYEPADSPIDRPVSALAAMLCCAWVACRTLHTGAGRFPELCGCQCAAVCRAVCDRACALPPSPAPQILLMCCRAEWWTGWWLLTPACGRCSATE